MTGMRLSFKCPCAFEKNDVMVSATETEHYMVFMCLQCKTLTSTQISEDQVRYSQSNQEKTCRKCRTKLMVITDPGA